jgi:iron-sulfur cluster insertion protein
VSETDGVRLVVDPVSLDLIAAARSITSNRWAARPSRSKTRRPLQGCGCGSSFGI